MALSDAMTLSARSCCWRWRHFVPAGVLFFEERYSYIERRGASWPFAAGGTVRQVSAASKAAERGGALRCQVAVKCCLGIGVGHHVGPQLQGGFLSGGRALVSCEQTGYIPTGSSCGETVMFGVCLAFFTFEPFVFTFFKHSSSTSAHWYLKCVSTAAAQ